MTGNISTNKEELRQSMRQARMALSPDVRRDKDAAIYEKLISSRVYRDARYVLVYVSCKDEVDTIRIIKKALLDGKIVAAPVVTGRRRMIYRIIRSMDDLRPGYMGVMEPGSWCENLCTVGLEDARPEDPKAAASGESMIAGQGNLKAASPTASKVAGQGIVLVPGLSFDKRGFRLGYGGGFYDTWLAENKDENCISIGLAYELQIVDELVCEEHDMHVDMIITEEEQDGY